MERVLVLVGVLALATVIGLVWRARTGRVHPTAAAETDRPAEPGHTAEPGAPAEPLDWSTLGIDPAAATVTLVQFSSAFCAPCRATRQILGSVAARWPEVAHVEVDAESHLDAVRALGVRSTPTTLVIDQAGQIVNRAVGQPREAEVIAVVGTRLSPRP
jgi:thiol-disulfide isomerase/thioredoxin